MLNLPFALINFFFTKILYMPLLSFYFLDCYFCKKNRSPFTSSESTADSAAGEGEEATGAQSEPSLSHLVTASKIISVYSHGSRGQH